MSTAPSPAFRRLRFAAATTTVLAVLTACGSQPKWRDSGAPRDPAPDITVTQPVAGATDVLTSTEIVYTAPGAENVTVTVTNSAGATVAGADYPLDASGASRPATASGSGAARSWLPAEQLDYATEYTATISAIIKAKRQVETVTFATMGAPNRRLSVSSVIGDDQVVGIGMPLVLTFNGGDVAEEQRAAVQRRLFVTSDPPQPGAWNWFNGHEVHFRPEEYWEPGTTFSLRAALGGLPMGNDRYGANDLTVDASIGQELIIKIDNATKQMTVTRDNQVLRTIPVSLGKPTSPSSSGNMVIMAKNREEWFDSSTYGVPADSADGYRTKVAFTQRITWGGEFIHAAPWSEGDQGVRNVSHGCTNISAANATWLFEVTQIGDPVVVTGTEARLKWGNGYTDWNIDFAEYQKGGATE